MSQAGFRWAGTRSVLVELESLDAVLGLHGLLLESPLPGQVDVLAAAETVLVKFDSRANALRGRAVLEGRLPDAGTGHAAQASPPVEIDVVYDGEDLAEVGRLTGLGPDGVVAAHTGQLWTAAFGGFAPGFAYLVGENTSLNVPRRGTPRTAVPAGSVALAGNFSAVYPRQSPGGWQLIGHTRAAMWDLGRDRPALVRPGDTVRYRAVRESMDLAGPGRDDHRVPDSREHAAALEVRSPGLQSLIQDLGRPGFGDLGVSASGAADQTAARQANRLVGNTPGAAVVESLLGGLEVTARGELVLALAGAETPAGIDGPRGPRPAPLRAPFALRDGETLALGAPSAGLRSYLAVRGGIAVPAVLGSRSTDSMSGIGHPPLAPGTVLGVGEAAPGQIVGHPEQSTLRPSGEVTLRITFGPRDDWFGPDAIDALTGHAWAATSQSNRIGVRLEPGPGARPLERIRGGELPSEGAVAGALQVPPSGLPVLFLADHPVTGGYPVVAVVVPEDLPAAAQLAPGSPVRFAVVDPDTLQSTAPPHAARLPEGIHP
jgi:KipI family sensor histidine kinase inhibitor